MSVSEFLPERQNQSVVQIHESIIQYRAAQEHLHSHFLMRIRNSAGIDPVKFRSALPDDLLCLFHELSAEGTAG